MQFEAKNIVSGYGDARILDGVDLSMVDDEMVCIIGPNGAGKSTLLKTIVGIVDTWEGKVEFAGEDITDLPPERVVDHGICYVPQDDNVFADLTIRENLRMGAWAAEDEAWFDFDDRVEAVYEQFPVLRERLSQRAGSLSGGQQQMVAMATALMLDPDLLILDEPSAGLAPKLIDDVFERIAEINDAGTQILMVEQNARRALRESDRGVVLDMGQNHIEGTGQDLLDSEEVTELYLGTT
jgi:branched-chain amino acid transport system ATP-binding protein